MKTYKKLFAIILSILIIFTMFPLSYAATYGTTYTPDSNGIQITVSNLTANPDTDVLPDEKCKIDFDWKVEFIEMQQWFKAGDKVEIPMNFNSVFNFNGGWSYPVYTSEDEEIAKFYAEKDKFVIEFNENVEGKMLTALKGSYLNYYELPMTKNMDISNDTPYTIKVGNAETNVTFAGGKYLEVKSRGNGDAKIKGHPAFIKVNEGQNIEIEGYPYSGEVLESVVLTKADGTEATLSAKKNKISISSDALLNGKNKVVFNFSEKQSHPGSGTPMNEWRWNAKQHWGNDKDKNGFDTKVRFSIELNYQALLGLYQSEGESLEHPGFGNNGAIDNLYFEDTLPGGSTAKFTSPGSNLPKVYARLAQYTTAKNTLGNTVTFPVDMQEGGHLQQTDLISSGILTRLTPSTGETLNVFRKRVKSVPLTWGIYLDNAGNSTFMVNLGSPGNPDGPAVKATDLWPDVLEKDSKLNKLNGAGNCVKGNVQAFRIDFYGDYTDNLYTMTNLINSGKCSYISDKGKEINDTLKSSKYNVPGKNSLAIPSKGGILIVKADTFKDHAISGAEFKVQKKDKNGDWKDYVNTTHNVVKGITDDEGQLLLNGLIPGEYRLIETSVPKPYDKNSSNYLTLQGNPITEDGTFTIKPDQESGSIVKVTNTKKFNITYHGNGGKGTLDEKVYTYGENSPWTPKAKGDLVKDDYQFIKWNTKADGTGIDYNVGENYTITEDIDLYAIWKKNPAPAELHVTGSKTLSGGNKTDKNITEGQFTFKVTADALNPENGVTDVPTGNISVKAGGAIDFGIWTFHKTGTYKFTISENQPPAGYTKADDIDMIVKVTYDNQNNVYTKSVTYSSDKGLEFHNVYVAPNPIVIEINGNKILSGDKNTEDISEGQFTFTITEDKGNDKSGYTGFNNTAKVREGGEIAFENLTVTKPGKYTFFITEDNLKEKGYTYDNACYAVTLNVELNEENNNLTVKSFVNKQGYVFRTNADSITFENHYKEGTEEPVIPETPDTPNTDDKSEISDDVNSTPQTGDSSSIYLWILLISASSLVLGTFVRFTKKSDK